MDARKMLLLACLAVGAVSSLHAVEVKSGMWANKWGEERGRRVKRIVGGTEAPPPPPDDPVAFDERAGAWVFGVRRKDHYAFLGIRYAEPPVGRLRFQRPRRVYLEGEVDATRAPPPCPQPGPSGEVIGSEDCLFLNVFTPQLPGSGPKESLPVLVWLHGGGFRRGSASQYGAAPLVRQRAVVVAPQYRLGALGFLSAASKELSGNAGLFDMTAALAWVQRHAEAFGGDPKRVTVFGQGSGAGAAVLLTLSTLSRGLLSGALALSGSALSSFAVDMDPLGTTRDIAKRANCPLRPPLALVRCLQQAPVAALVQADSAIEEMRLRAQGLLGGLTGLLGAAPVVDGPDDERGPPPFLARPPLELLKGPLDPTGILEELPLPPLVIGVAAAETATAIYGDYKDEILHGIATVPGYVDNLLGGLIKCTAPLVGNMTGTLLHTLATNYFSFLSIKDTPQAFKRLVEVTGDALFNLPAWTTAQWWSKRAPLFFYVFDHHPKKPGGSSAFLQGLPLVSRPTAANNEADASSSDAIVTPPADVGPGHGDDLPFMWDAHTITVPEDGHREPENVFSLEDPQDFAVMGHVTDFIAEFARNGRPLMPGTNSSWPAWSSGSAGNHVRLAAQPKTASSFRACQMELWTGALARTGLPAAMCAAADVASALPAGALGLSAAAARGTEGVLTQGMPAPPVPLVPLAPPVPVVPIRNIIG